MSSDLIHSCLTFTSVWMWIKIVFGFRKSSTAARMRTVTLKRTMSRSSRRRATTRRGTVTNMRTAVERTTGEQITGERRIDWQTLKSQFTPGTLFFFFLMFSDSITDLFALPSRLSVRLSLSFCWFLTITVPIILWSLGTIHIQNLHNSSWLTS